MIKIEYSKQFWNDIKNESSAVYKDILSQMPKPLPIWTSTNMPLDSLVQVAPDLLNDLLTKNIFVNPKYSTFIDEYCRIMSFIHKYVKRKKGNNKMEWKKRKKRDFRTIEDIPCIKSKMGTADYEKSILEVLRKIVEEIDSLDLSYKKVSYEAKKEIREGLGIRVCPYCNRNVIETIDNPNKKSKTHELNLYDIDHIYPKAIFPLFQISLYNFVPSCIICNTKLKGSYDAIGKILNPYVEGFENDFKFVDIGGVIDIVPTSDKVNKDKIKKMIKSVSLFGIKSRYQNDDYYRLLLEKKTIDWDEEANDAFIDFMKKAKIDGISKEMLFYGYEFDEKEDYLIPLSRYTRDIIKNRIK